MVRAKFTVTELREMSGFAGRTVVLTARYDSDIEEDRRFAKATPTGRLEMYVDNPAAIPAFPLGSVHYLDFTSVAAPAPAAGVSGNGTRPVA